MIPSSILAHIAAVAHGNEQLTAAAAATLAACGVEVGAPMPRGQRGAVLAEEIPHIVDFHAAMRATDAKLEVLLIVTRRWRELSRGAL